MSDGHGEDPDLDAGDLEDCSEASWASGEDPEGASLFSEDSVFPDYDSEDSSSSRDSSAALSLYQACTENNARALHESLERGVSEEEVLELDINGRNGLMVACYKGFVDIVFGLDKCPYLDINHQDNDGNTALMIAAQAGHMTIVNYLLNYYPGVDLERRDIRGFTAFMKAAMQGRSECVSSLMMAGVDLNAVDPTRGKTAKEWAILTGRFETLTKMRRLLEKPCAEQFCDRYTPEWPELRNLVAKAVTVKTRSEKITQRIRSTFTINFPQDPEDDGVLDHMVRMTTGISSPFVTTGCRPLCPTSPPAVGKKRFTVPEILRQCPGKQVENRSVQHSNGSVSDSSSCCGITEESQRGSMLSNTGGVRGFSMRRNSVFPVGCIPQIKVSKSMEPTPKKEKKKKSKSKHFLELPKWRYKELKEERKKVEKEKEEKKVQEKKDKKEKKDKEEKKDKKDKKDKEEKKDKKDKEEKK
ncbi:photoreceptor ankyrin repeat protein [Acipenser oxyrinchus oxyrinchus]|uniref:Photoreceptor ankyrin repeat protein n=1 Tax=Acipenser oxyrinchus oxyrinchus TaxID=40147 RepID=A0AAD8FT27_ACIOX|nr:photoreceptor ankyrin repeat protein [Acipenser oxyrinchus oxyrinchus]